MPQANIQRKKLHGSRSQDCLVISLGGGIKVQYPIANESEALALYSYYYNLHPNLKKIASQT